MSNQSLMEMCRDEWADVAEKLVRKNERLEARSAYWEGEATRARRRVTLLVILLMAFGIGAGVALGRSGSARVEAEQDLAHVRDLLRQCRTFVKTTSI